MNGHTLDRPNKSVVNSVPWRSLRRLGALGGRPVVPDGYCLAVVHVLK